MAEIIMVGGETSDLSWCLSSHPSGSPAAMVVLAQLVSALPANTQDQRQQLVRFIVCLLLIWFEPSETSLLTGPRSAHTSTE